MLRLLPLLALLLSAPLASAQWNPPGTDDPCDSPLINCIGGGGENGFTRAADAVGEALEKQASEDPVKGFIWWFAHTFGPQIRSASAPQTTAPSDSKPTPSTGPTFPDEGGDTAADAYVLGGREAISIIRDYLDNLKEGDRLKLGDYEGDARFTSMKQPNRRDRSTYLATFEVRDGRRILMVYAYANGKGLYLVEPKRER